MKRCSICAVLVVLLTTQIACGLLTLRSAASTPAGLSATPFPTAAAGRVETPLPADTRTPEPTFTHQPAETPSSGRISLDMLKNFTYWVEDFNIQAALKDGVYSDGNIQVHWIEPAAFGDLNADGREDAAVILAVKSGGSGTFYDLVALLDQDGTPVQAGFSYIGDRQIVNNLQIAHGRMILDYQTQGLNDPLCCPSEHRLRSYLLENAALRLVGEQILDGPTAHSTPLPDEILIDQPVAGNQITAPLQVRGRLSQVPPEKKLAYNVTDLNAALLMHGEIPLDGEPGGPGAFAFEINLGALSPGLIQIEVLDSAGGILRGRSIVVLVAP